MRWPRGAPRLSCSIATRITAAPSPSTLHPRPHGLHPFPSPHLILPPLHIFPPISTSCVRSSPLPVRGGVCDCSACSYDTPVGTEVLSLLHKDCHTSRLSTHPLGQAGRIYLCFFSVSECDHVVDYSDALLMCRRAPEGSARGAATPAAEQALLQEGCLLHVPLLFRRCVFINCRGRSS
jgi:hypothetical protein